ncbi:MAG: response regulator, partial [Rubrivivax sp.]
TGPAASPLAGRRLLVVDDSADSAESFGLLLELTGAKVRTAASGALALQALDDEPCDVLISDVSMPGMSGLQLIQTLRQRAGGGDLVALACSGYSRAQDEADAIEAGFDALIPKPASLDHVEQVVLGLFQRRSAK